MSGADEIDVILARLDSREERFAEGVERRTASRAERARQGTDPGGDSLADGLAVAPRTRRYTPADLAADAAAYARIQMANRHPEA